jgi:hypothetical protein
MKKSVFQLRIDLMGAKPPIWRRILIASNASLYDLHCAIQNAMGWQNSHLHVFEKNGVYYAPGDLEEMDFGEGEDMDEKQYTVQDVLPKENETLQYEYDFGDGWAHQIKLEKILLFDPDQALPICIKGRNACPPEDIGGLWGYDGFLDIMADPRHPEYEEMLEWVGGEFDPTVFDLEEANAVMAEGCFEYMF